MDYAWPYTAHRKSIMSQLNPHLRTKTEKFNFCHHNDEFCIDVKWLFLPPHIAKKADNGTAGPLKGLATKWGLQCTYAEQIISRQLFDYECSTIQGINFDFATVKEDKDEELLYNRLLHAEQFQQQASLLLPLSADTLEEKPFQRAIVHDVRG